MTQTGRDFRAKKKRKINSWMRRGLTLILRCNIFRRARLIFSRAGSQTCRSRSMFVCVPHAFLHRPRNQPPPPPDAFLFIHTLCARLCFIGVSYGFATFVRDVGRNLCAVGLGPFMRYMWCIFKILCVSIWTGKKVLSCLYVLFVLLKTALCKCRVSQKHN